MSPFELVLPARSVSGPVFVFFLAATDDEQVDQIDRVS
jgi:hypothetical protein